MWDINRRVHLAPEELCDGGRETKGGARPPRRLQFNCETFDGISKYRAWMFKKSCPGFVFFRKSMCVCPPCLSLKFEECELKDVYGGPGQWVEKKINPLTDENQRRDIKRRAAPASSFEIRKSGYYAVRVSPGADSSRKPYLIVQAASAVKSAPYDIKTPHGGMIPKGGKIIDVRWLERDFKAPLTFFPGNGGRTSAVPVSLIVPIKVSWAGSASGNRTLTQTSDASLLAHLEKTSNEVDENSESDESVGHLSGVELSKKQFVAIRDEAATFKIGQITRAPYSKQNKMVCSIKWWTNEDEVHREFKKGHENVETVETQLIFFTQVSWDEGKNGSLVLLPDCKKSIMDKAKGVCRREHGSAEDSDSGSDYSPGSNSS